MPYFVVCPGLLLLSLIYGTMLFCCLYPALLPMLCIFACVLNLWHCARLLPLSCFVTHALYFCLCPVILPVSWVVICHVLPMSCVVKRVLSPAASYKPGVKLNMGEAARFVHPLQTLRCAVPFTRRRQFCFTRVSTKKHACNFHAPKNRSASLTRISRFSCVY